MRIVGLGDSVGFGVGDTGPGFIGPGWSGRLAQIVGAHRVLNLSQSGARATDVFRKQLGGALEFRPEVAVICIGGNDVLRANFDPQEIHTALSRTVAALQEINCRVAVLGITDPNRTAPAPALIKAAISRRTRSLNTALEAVCTRHNADFINLWHDDEAYKLEYWHVDRMHPSAKGYQRMAELTCDRLGIPYDPQLASTTEAVDVPNRWLWLILFGSIWLFKRMFDLFPRLAMLCIQELRIQRNPALDYKLNVNEEPSA